MDIKAKINELVEKIKSNKELFEKFKADPIKTIEGLIGIDLPDDKIKQLVEGIEAKLTIDDIGDKIGGLANKLGGLFGKK